jgi:penicillin-binding protein 1C
MTRRLRNVVVTVAIVAMTLVALRLFPASPLAVELPRSTALYAEDGALLRLTLASDQQYRLWVPLERMSPRMAEAVQLYEDRWYYWHPGVNPVALVRAGFATYSGGTRQGASTITMQLARRLYRIDSRTPSGKLRQIAAALWLEARHSKREILEAYLNVAPYGGNIEGVGAASLIYFHKRAQDLTLPETLALAVIPQNPRQRIAARRTVSVSPLSAELAQARERLAVSWFARHPDDRKLAADLALPLAPWSASQLPFRAPHLTDALLATAAGKPGDEIRTSLDWRLQSTLERQVARYVEQQQNIGIRNAAAMLVDTQTMQVKALVGSVDYRADDIDGQVNGTAAKRSPGSTLKPFIYALALDQGVLHPRTVLKDAPSAFGPFSPENFDGRFVGPITAQDALIASRNVPAVTVAAKLTRPSLYDFLHDAGVSKMASERHYGLALALGGGEVTMDELARMYAMLANRGVLKPLVYRSDAPPAEGVRLVSDEAAFITLDMLERNPRPDTGEPSRRPVAWKTGTSWGFRDAWTAGVFGRYVLVVWVGNFDGSGNPSFVGVRAAAPLFFRIVDAIRAQRTDGVDIARRQPQSLARIEVCAASGDLPNEWCRERATTWFIPGKSPIKVSTLHRAVLIDARTGSATCSEDANTRREIYEFWPSDLKRLFREAGMPRREPPALPDCTMAQSAFGADAPQIASPMRGVTYTLRISQPSAIPLQANRTGSGPVYWFANEGLVARSDAGEAQPWNPAAPGRYVVRAVDDRGGADSRVIDVEFVP